MNFTIFRIFSDFLLIYFRFKLIKIIKIKAKSSLFLCGATWMRCGTQGHVALPRGPTRRLRGVHIYFIYILYIMGIHPSVYRKGIQPIRSSSLINPTFFFNLFRVGLKSHTVYFNAADVA